jgi:hypothetical protein
MLYQLSYLGVRHDFNRTLHACQANARLTKQIFNRRKDAPNSDFQPRCDLSFDIIAFGG